MPSKSGKKRPPKPVEPEITPEQLYRKVRERRVNEFQSETGAESIDVTIDGRPTEAFEIPNCEWSERYHPSVYVANYRAYLKYFGKWLKPILQYGENKLVVPKGVLWLMPEDEYNELKETIVKVRDDYPLVDDQFLSDVESEMQENEWEETYRDELRSVLSDDVDTYVGDQVDRDGNSIAERIKEELLTQDSVVDNIRYELEQGGDGSAWSEGHDGDWSLDIDRLYRGSYVSPEKTMGRDLRDQERVRYHENRIVNELVDMLLPKHRDDPDQLKFPFHAEVANVVEALLEHAVDVREDPHPAAKILAHMLLEGHEYSCVMIPLPDELRERIVAWGKTQIPEEALFVDKDGGKGREEELHVTVKYGLLDPMPSPYLMDLFKRTKPFEVRLAPITLFRQDSYDVVKLDVSSPQLLAMNRDVCQAAPHHDTFKEYHPHVTIAYVKKGMGDRLEGVSPFDDTQKLGVTSIGTEGKFDATSVIFSSSSDVKREYHLGKSGLKEDIETPPPDPSPEDIRRLVKSAGRSPRFFRGSTLRKVVGRELINRVEISKVDDIVMGRGSGLLKIFFDRDRPVHQRYASFEVLKMAIRQWRNLYGAPLYVNGEPAGVVSYRNPALQDESFPTRALVGGV